MFKSDKRPGKYILFAEAAAEMERSGNYQDAAFAWAGAAHQANNPQNQHWAIARSDYCYSCSKQRQAAA